MGWNSSIVTFLRTVISSRPLSNRGVSTCGSRFSALWLSVSWGVVFSLFYLVGSLNRALQGHITLTSLDVFRLRRGYCLITQVTNWLPKLFSRIERRPSANLVNCTAMPFSTPLIIDDRKLMHGVHSPCRQLCEYIFVHYVA